MSDWSPSSEMWFRFCIPQNALKKSSISLHTLKYKLILFFSFRRGNSTRYESSAALQRSVCGCHADRWHCPGCWFHAMSQSLEGRKPYCLFKVHKGLTTKNITVLTELKGLSGQNTLSEVLERSTLRKSGLLLNAVYFVLHAWLSCVNVIHNVGNYLTPLNSLPSILRLDRLAITITNLS